MRFESWSLKLALGTFGRVGIEAYAGGEPAATISAALDHYVRQLRTGRAVVRYPRFRRGPTVRRELVNVEASCPGTRLALEREAREQGVAVECLVEHALFVYLADRGRPGQGERAAPDA